MIIQGGQEKDFDNGEDYFVELAIYNQAQAYLLAEEEGTLEDYYQEYPEDRPDDWAKEN